MWLLDTNILIHCKKKDIKRFSKEKIFTTMFSLIEFPLASNFENLTTIFPSSLHYEQAFRNSVFLRKKGTPIPTIDLLIGTITIDKNMILVSDDSHFQYLKAVDPRLKIMKSDDFIKNILEIGL